MILVTMQTDTDYSEWFISEDNETYVREMLNSLPDIQMMKMMEAKTGTPSFAPPFLKSGRLVIGQTANGDAGLERGLLPQGADLHESAAGVAGENFEAGRLVVARFNLAQREGHGDHDGRERAAQVTLRIALDGADVHCLVLLGKDPVLLLGGRGGDGLGHPCSDQPLPSRFPPAAGVLAPDP